MKSVELYSDIADFRNYVNGLEADTSFNQLKTSIKAAARQVVSVITSSVYDAIADMGQGAEALELLKSAVASCAMYQYQIFASVKKNKTDGSLYKYQHEEIKEHHINSYWLTMDELLEWLDENNETGDYKDTDIYKDREELPIRNAREFDSYYGIDASSYFYSKILFLIKSIWRNSLRPMLPEQWEDDKTLADKVKRTLCYYTVAEAVIKFDVTELPRSIRYDFNHEYTKGTSPQTRDKLHADLMSDVKIWTQQISNLVKASSGTTAIQQNINKEKNKFYMM